MIILRRMIRYRKNSSFKQSFRDSLRTEPYLIVNFVFAGVILLVLAYSGFFSAGKNDYPVACLHEKLTGESCVSCGLSHSFSLIVRGRLDEAYQWNIYAMGVFLFFVSQLFLRLIFSVFYLRNTDTRKQLIIMDCIGSGLIFLIAFLPFIENIFSGVYAATL